MKRTGVFLGLAAGLLLSAISFLWYGDTVPEPIQEAVAVDIPPGYPLVRHIQYHFLLENTRSVMARDVRFQVFAPLALTPWQKREDIQASEDFTLLPQEAGQMALQFDFARFPPHGKRRIQIRVRLAMSAEANPRPLTDPATWLQAAPLMEVEHPALRQRAAQLGQSGETADRIYRWVAGHIRYTGYRRKSLGALHALKTREGDCTEYMSLFVALARAGNIPARGAGGFVVREDSNLTSRDYHNWAEYRKGGTWHLVDPQHRRHDTATEQYIAFSRPGDRAVSGGSAGERFHLDGTGMQAHML